MHESTGVVFHLRSTVVKIKPPWTLSDTLDLLDKYVFLEDLLVFTAFYQNSTTLFVFDSMTVVSHLS